MPLTPDDRVDAAELVLRLVDGEERATLLRRVLAEPEFAAAVEEWREAFAALLVSYPEADPPAWIERRLAAIGSDARPWRWGAAAASLVAASLAFALLIRPAPVAPPQEIRASPPIAYAAAMVPAKDRQGTAFAAVFDPGLGQVRLPLSIDVPDGRVAELWRIGADGVPHALGLLTGGKTITVALGAEDRAALAAGATLAVSIEPPGGSPTKAPTGPVIATGALIRL